MEIDLSLMEISGEDDSLLQNESDDFFAFNNSSSFSCSPLLLHRSEPLLAPIETGNEMAENRSLNQCVDAENRILNQPEAPKLGVEPQQMKRKKKGGGFNLRKSLAWNRAFFTEEGVLSSSELSLISGNVGSPGGEKLLVIHEDGESELGCMDSAADSVGLQALENNLFKELPVNNPSVASSKPKQKVHSARDLSRSGSKSKLSGCARPVVSSILKGPGNVNTTTLKRPANVNMTKGTNKESKVSKIPVSKVDSKVLCTSAKNLQGASKSKRDQTTKPDKIQKTVPSTGCSIARKSNFASRSLMPKSSSQQARRNVGGSTSKIQPSANVLNSAVKKTDNSLKVNSKQDHVTVDCVSNSYGVSKKNDSLPQNCCNVRGTKQHLQAQIAKPSGLRMPSPSLGFFTQPKSSATHGLSQDSQRKHGPQSNIPDVSKFSAFKTIGARNRIGATGNMTQADSSALRSVPSTVTAIVHENIKANSQASAMLMVDVKVPPDLNNKIHETTDIQKQFERIPGDVEQQVKDVKLQNKLVSQSGLSEEVEKENDINANHIGPESRDARNAEFQSSHFMLLSRPQTEGDYNSGTDDVTNSQVAADKEHNLSTENAGLLKELQLSNENDSSMHGSSKACDDFVNTMNDVNRGQADKISSCSISNDQTIDDCQRQRDGSPAMPSGTFRDLHLHNSAKYEITSSEIGCSSGGLESLHCSTHGRDEKSAKDGVSGSNDMSGKFTDGNERMHSCGGNLPSPCSKHFSHASIVENQHLVHAATNEKVNENPEVSDSCLVAPRDFQDHHGSQLTECFLHREIVSAEEFVDGDGDEFPTDGKADSSNCKLEGSSFTSKVTPAMQHQIAGLGCEDWKGEHDADLLEASSNEFEEIEEVQVAGLVNAINDSKVCQIHGDLPNSPAGQAKVDSEIEDGIDPPVMETNENKSYVDNHSAVSNLRMEENIGCQQGHQVSNEDAFVDNAASGSSKSNQLDDDKRPHLDVKNKLSGQTASLLYDFPSLRVEQKLGPIISCNSKTVCSFDEDTGLLVEDTGQTFLSRGSDFPSLRKEQNWGPVSPCNSKTVFSLKEDTGLVIEADQTFVSGDILQYKEVNMPDDNSFMKEADINISGVEMIQDLKTVLNPVENEDLTRKTGNDKMQAPLTIKPPPNAVPFSDEWLAAFEAAGEEILAKKSGAVQNSPQDKSLPEPGPWSPVKRKSNQEIGPFDCTKYSNTIGLPPGSNEG